MSEEGITPSELAELQNAAGITPAGAHDRSTQVHPVASTTLDFVNPGHRPEQNVRSLSIGPDGKVVDNGTPVERQQAERAALRKERGEVLIGSDNVMIEDGLYLVTDVHETEEGKLAFGVKRQATEEDPNAPYRPDNKTEVRGSDMLTIAKAENNQPPSILVNIPSLRDGEVGRGWVFSGVSTQLGAEFVQVTKSQPAPEGQVALLKRDVLLEDFLRVNGANASEK